MASQEIDLLQEATGICHFDTKGSVSSVWTQDSKKKVTSYIPALRTARVMALQEIEIAFMRMASSWSPVLLITNADRVGVDAWSTWSGSWGLEAMLPTGDAAAAIAADLE